jgi:hypothetical protein
MRRLAATASAGLLIVVILVVAQLVLPGIAASMLRDRLQKSGKVLSVQVSAFPAIELLWHDADKVVIHLASYHANPGHLESLLDEAGGVGTLDVTTGVLSTGLLTLHDATLSKQGDQLTGRAQVYESDLRASLPVLQSVAFVSSGNRSLTLRGTASLFGVSGSVDGTVGPQDGRLVATIGGIASFTLFSNPDIEIESVSGASAPNGLSVSTTARFR